MKFVGIIILLLLHGCLYVEESPHSSTHDSSHVEIYHNHYCDYTEPYEYTPDLCIMYQSSQPPAEFTCCVWYVGWGWSEEWCIWNDSCGWKFNTEYYAY
ncbi:hypothetical protein CMI47_16240 [Candidatus Pacearchaeota archaeon]|nr:hypothetical protein [Candidatus Pacearchaeota archaeon]